jgi:hypothetical protein
MCDGVEQEQRWFSERLRWGGLVETFVHAELMKLATVSEVHRTPPNGGAIRS